MAGYPKATHCRTCGREFTEELPKYLTHAKCEPCVKKEKYNKDEISPKEFWQYFNKNERNENLKEVNNELKKMKSREEWLVFLHKRFDAIQIEIKL